MTADSPRKFLFGSRGTFPVLFTATPSNGVGLPITAELKERLCQMPGVLRTGIGVRATWDAAVVIADILERPLPLPQLEAAMSPAQILAECRQQPGWEQAAPALATARDYQVSGALFLARRSYALLCDPMRAGKTRTALMGARLSGASRTLIVCPAIARAGWAEEIARWCGSEALLLEGRSGDRARRYCVACDGRGRDDSGARCKICANKNGQSDGYKIFVRGDPDRELDDAIAAAEFVIVNYELLVPQQASSGTGKLLSREDLPGWAPYLATTRFDLAIADEAHVLRGWSTDRLRVGKSRRERFVLATDRIPAVWGVTGTPIFGYIRDLWGPLDAVSKGAVTGPGRKPYKFHAYFCDGHTGEYGWVDTGRSAAADTELPKRLEGIIKLQRPRSQILAHMPPKVRQVVRIDPDPGVTAALRAAAGSARGPKKLATLLRQSGVHKRQTVADNVCAELAEGNKVVVFSLLRANADGLYKTIVKTRNSKEWSARLSSTNTTTFLAHGDVSVDARVAAARAFREHHGAAVFVTTIDAMQVAISLRGATSVHFADLHWSPPAMLQAEDRPYEPGTTGLSVVYYMLRESIDEHVLSTVLPKLTTVVSSTADEQAQQTKDSFSEKTTLDEVYERLTRAVRQQMEEDEWIQKLL